jgi:hypothetical protein
VTLPGPPPKCLACGSKEFTAPKDIHGYVPATFGWFGDPLVGFACAKCGYVHLYLKPRKKVGERPVRGKEPDAPPEETAP